MPSFNPLHCGAVVASCLAYLRTQLAPRVSIPFIAGQWSLQAEVVSDKPLKPVSIPFIAGQWSLLKPRDTLWAIIARFNPLHCGAVVASRVPGCEDLLLSGFNPLHCGAVVASCRMAGGEGPPGSRFNPLHCGAVVASVDQDPDLAAVRLVSIPFIAGQWSLLASGDESPFGLPCFNPLHCGAVVASFYY